MKCLAFFLYKYDAYGILSKIIYPDNTTEEFTYDKLRNVLSSTDGNKNTTYYKYDRMSRLTYVKYPNGLEVNYTYDKAGNLIKIKDSTNQETNYTYDKAGRNTEITNSLGNKTTFEYTSTGKVSKVIDAKGNSVEYKYDNLGRKTKIISGTKTLLSCEYDALGRVTSQTDGENNKTTYSYDEVGNLIGVTNPLNQKTSYKYNEIGNLTEETDANGNTTKYAYDNLGRVVSRILPLGQKESYKYDNNGNLIEVTDFNGKVTKYEYNSNNQMSKKILSDGKTTEYSYDSKGYLVSVKDSSGTMSFVYDSVGNLTKQTNANGEVIEYSYDKLGNVTLIKTPNTSTKYEYDILGRLSKVTDKNNLVTKYTYDSVGNLIKEEKGNGSYTTYEYDNLYRLKKLVNKKSNGEVISSYEYTTDNRGLRTKVVDNKGKTTDYTYDNAGKLIKEVVTENGKVTLTASYSYDSVGNRLTKTENNITTNYTYDKNNRLLKEGNISYTYDNAGNLIKKQSTAETTEYAYNLDGKLSLVKKTSGSTVTNESYSYNAFGTRIKKVTNGEEERYLVDEYTSYSRVLEEKNKNNNLTATYTYGHELISQNRATSVSFYNRDGLGSTTSLTNASQTVTDTYSYDAFGNLINSTGTTKNNYLFAGEEKDNTTGYYYLRARYMDTTTGRFTSMDSYLGSVDDPVSLHKYLYANANPVNYIDPSGYNSYGEMNLALKIQLILTDITTLKINMYCWYIRLGEASIGGKILKEVIDESFELLLEGDVDICSVMWTGVEVVYGLAGSEKEISTLKKTTKSGSLLGGDPVDKVYYHVTTKERAQQIIASGELGVRGNKWESRVFAWTKQPTKKQASIAGIGKDAQTVIKFNTKASFEPGKGNKTKKSIADIVVQTTDGETVPILIKNVEIVGFKKEWWQFWKK